MRIRDEMKSDLDQNALQRMETGSAGMEEKEGRDGISLFDTLRLYADTDLYPFHMPGHKRRLGSLADPYTFDITEVDGLDNLHHPEGILLEAQKRAARLYGADETFFLINGSTSGILASVAAARIWMAMRPEEGRTRMIVARNSHKALYHALYLNRMEPVYLYPEKTAQNLNGPVSPEAVAEALKGCPEAGAVFITSPTYDGIVSPVGQIARICHEAGCLLIVDEAHGAHFGFHPALPPSSVGEGADLVIHSVHKTLPALTQSALLHVRGGRIRPELIRRQLGIYMSSSPSYVLMASIDQSIRCMEHRGGELLEQLLDTVGRFRFLMEPLHDLYLLDTDDPTRLLIACRDHRLSGREICAILRRKFWLEPEMATEDYVLCLLSVGDDEEGLMRLYEALEQIDRELFLEKTCPGRRSSWLREFVETRSGVSADAAGQESMKDRVTGNRSGNQKGPEEASPSRRTMMMKEDLPNRNETQADQAVPLWKAWDLPWEVCPLEESAGHICAEFVYLYPPGIPLLAPGERITGAMAETLAKERDRGGTLQGAADYSMRTLRVIREDRKED